MQNINQSKNPTIVTSANNSYKDFLYVLLVSLKLNTNGPIDVFVLHDGLKIELKKKLIKIAQNSYKLSFINVNDIISPISSSSYLKDPHYWRLLAPHILSERENILYLDADIMIRKDITTLFTKNSSGKTISATVDYLQNIELGISNWKDFNFNPKIKYFNSGVMIINTEQFIQKKIAEQVLEIVEEYAEFTKACGKWEQFDQYGLNVCLYNDWQLLPSSYNYGSELIFRDAVIVHFLGQGKPGSESCTREYTDEFYTYLNKSFK